MIRRALLHDLATVQTYQGESAYGPAYAEPVTVRCAIDSRRRLVRTASGDEVVSETSLTVHPRPRNEADQTVLDARELFAVESTVQVDGHPSQVISVQPHRLRGRVVHVEVALA